MLLEKAELIFSIPLYANYCGQLKVAGEFPACSVTQLYSEWSVHHSLTVCPSKVFVAGYLAAKVTCYVRKIFKTCSPMIGLSCDTSTVG